MINTNKHHIILSNYPFASGQLSPNEAHELEDVQEWKISVREFSGSSFKKVTKELTSSLLKNFKVYFIYCETFPQPKSKMRTFKKMFHGQKSELGINNLFELEIDIEDNKSILTGILRIDEKNMDTAMDQINSNFSFGLAVKKTKRSFPSNKATFLQQLKEIALKGVKSSKTNILKAISKNLDAHKIIFVLRSTGNDEEIISLFSRNKNNFSKELDKVIESNKSIMEN